MLLQKPTLLMVAFTAGFSLAAPAIGNHGLPKRERPQSRLKDLQGSLKSLTNASRKLQKMQTITLPNFTKTLWLTTLDSEASVRPKHPMPIASAWNLMKVNGANQPLANGATDSCDCSPSKIGYYLHKRCVCSENPIEASSTNRASGDPDSKLSVTPEPGAESTDDCSACPNGKVPTYDLSGQCTCDHAKEVRALRTVRGCPRCPISRKPLKDANGQCHCVYAPIGKREASSIESARTSNRIHGIQAINPIMLDLEKRIAPDAIRKSIVKVPELFKLYYAVNPISASFDCLVFIECVKGQPSASASIRAQATPDGKCICMPKKTGRDLSSMKDDTNPGHYATVPLPGSLEVERSLIGRFSSDDGSGGVSGDASGGGGLEGSGK
ncbi:MAG: hypothetical protein Q9209_005002 [Squamulea sp. 1 TL-2023]